MSHVCLWCVGRCWKIQRKNDAFVRWMKFVEKEAENKDFFRGYWWREVPPPLTSHCAGWTAALLTTKLVQSVNKIGALSSATLLFWALFFQLSSAAILMMSSAPDVEAERQTRGVLPAAHRNATTSNWRHALLANSWNIAALNFRGSTDRSTNETA